VTKYLWIRTEVSERTSRKIWRFKGRSTGTTPVRHISRAWREAFYAGFELWKHKRDSATFPAVLGDMKQRTSNFEASFCSKVVAVLDPTAPVKADKAASAASKYRFLASWRYQT
jgi:hypothetical protein